LDLIEKLTPIYVTKPVLPPLEEFVEGLEKIWESRVLTNMGPYHQLLEEQLREYLDVPHLSLFSNATLALYTALKVLNLDNSEIITTPFSFPATSNVIRLVNSKPVFADIIYKDCCINPKYIKSNISIYTKAIMPVHVYGNWCDYESISKLSKKHNLKVIYDAAHAFAPSNEILKYGDLSVISFHATKIFNTLEGGAIISHSKEMKERIDRFRNSGISSEDSIPDVGINAKMNEIQALIGVLNLKNIDSVIEARRSITNYYNNFFSSLLKSSNCSYYPIIVDKRQDLVDELSKEQIFARKYFYPLISNLPQYRSTPSAFPSKLPVANAIAEQVLCLPLYPELHRYDQCRVIDIVSRYIFRKQITSPSHDA